MSDASQEEYKSDGASTKPDALGLGKNRNQYSAEANYYQTTKLELKRNAAKTKPFSLGGGSQLGQAE